MAGPSSSALRPPNLPRAVEPFGGRHVVVTREAVDGRVAQRAQRGRVQCRSAPKRSANCPVPRICSASERRADSVGATRGPKRGLARHSANATADQQQQRGWCAEAPQQTEHRGVVLFGEEHDDVAALQLRRGHEQPRMVAEQEIAKAKRRGVDHRDAAAPHGRAQRMDSVFIAQAPTGPCARCSATAFGSRRRRRACDCCRPR